MPDGGNASPWDCTSQTQESFPFEVSFAAVLALNHHFSSSNLVGHLLKRGHHDTLVHRKHPEALDSKQRHSKRLGETENGESR